MSRNFGIRPVSTFNAPADDWRHLGNYLKTNEAIVRQAIAESGQAVKWRDRPNEQMPANMAHDYGSVWAKDRDCSRFWAAYYRIEKAKGAR